MKFNHLVLIITAAVATAAASNPAGAQTHSRQGAGGRGYNVTRTGGVSGTGYNGSTTATNNNGHGVTMMHESTVNARGIQTGSSTVTTANGASASLNGAYYGGVYHGTATATSPSGTTKSVSGTVAVPPQ